MKKKLIGDICLCFAAGFAGKLVYDLVSKPDGYLYIDPDTKAVYAALEKDPDKYKLGSRLVFVMKG